MYIAEQLIVAESRRQQTERVLITTKLGDVVTRECDALQTQRMLVTRTVRALGMARGSRSLWTGRESLETDDPEMWGLVQAEKQRQVRW